MRDLPNLNAVRAFESAARHESFAQAAAETGVTQAAVSRHVRNLELELGLVLFERGHRSISLTPAGRAYAERISEGLSIIAGRGRAGSKLQSRRIVVEVDSDLLTGWLLPLVTPDVLSTLGVDLDLRSRLEWPRQLPLETDLAIIWGGHESPGFRSSPYLATRGFAACAPQLEGGRPAPKDTSELAGHRLIHERGDAWWRRMLLAANQPPPDGFQGLYLQRSYQAEEAAAKGLGLVVGDDVLFAHTLRSGRLVRIPGPILPGSKMYFLLEPAGRRVPAEVKAVRDWLLTEASAHKAWQAEFLETAD
jgi:LysR family transcriptional regulator, glycine cleavage system transcriptional activator